MCVYGEARCKTPGLLYLLCVSEAWKTGWIESLLLIKR